MAAVTHDANRRRQIKSMCGDLISVCSSRSLHMSAGLSAAGELLCWVLDPSRSVVIAQPAACTLSRHDGPQMCLLVQSEGVSVRMRFHVVSWLMNGVLGSLLSACRRPRHTCMILFVLGHVSMPGMDTLL